jgi:uncharacterized protein YodC (DUF2158 family)
MPEFKAGDTARMKSGGPLMTIKTVKPDGVVWCEWFDDKQTPQSRGFQKTSLVADDGRISV